MTLAEIILYFTGLLVAVVTFSHRLYWTTRGKMSRKAYRCAKWGISFLVAGLIGVFVSTWDKILNGEPLVVLPGNSVMILFFMSGVWLLIGLINIVRYYRYMGRLDT